MCGAPEEKASTDMSKTDLIFTDFSVFPPVSGTRMFSVRMLVQGVIIAVHVIVLFSHSLRQGKTIATILSPGTQCRKDTVTFLGQASALHQPAF